MCLHTSHTQILYIGVVTTVAVPVVAAHLLLAWPAMAPSARRYVTLAFASAACGVLTAMPMDRLWCRWAGSKWNHTMQLFLCCDLIYVWLLGYLCTVYRGSGRAVQGKEE